MMLQDSLSSVTTVPLTWVPMIRHFVTLCVRKVRHNGPRFSKLEFAILKDIITIDAFTRLSVDWTTADWAPTVLPS